MSNTILAQLTAFNAKWTARGGSLTWWKCPNTSCNEMVQTRQPTAEDVSEKGYWDSLTGCPHCGMGVFLVVWPDGKTTSRKAP